MDTSVIIMTTRNGEKKQRSFTHINPSATDNQLIEFAGKLVEISADTYIGAVRVDKKELVWTEANG